MAATTTPKLPDSLKKRIAPLADAAGKEKRKAFYAEARARLAEFRRTGIACRAADVHRYFGALVGGRKVKKPRPVKVSRRTR